MSLLLHFSLFIPQTTNTRSGNLSSLRTSRYSIATSTPAHLARSTKSEIRCRDHLTLKVAQAYELFLPVVQSLQRAKFDLPTLAESGALCRDTALYWHEKEDQTLMFNSIWMRDIDAPLSFPSQKLGLDDNQEATKGLDKARNSFSIFTWSPGTMSSLDDTGQQRIPSLRISWNAFAATWSICIRRFVSNQIVVICISTTKVRSGMPYSKMLASRPLLVLRNRYHYLFWDSEPKNY
jgi:hypothetical protein